MKCKIMSILLLITIGMFFHGCASESPEEDLVSEVNEESVNSTDAEEANNDENLTGFAISGGYTLFRAAESDPDAVVPETDTLETPLPNETASDWGEIYYDRYYKIWDSEEMMLSEIENRSEYRDNCSFYSDAVYYIEGGGGEFMLKTDISSLIEPLYPSDLVYMEEEDFKDYPPILLHIFKNEIYARHGYIFKNEDLNNYFRGMIWYTPQYEPGDFDVSVFNEIEVHNLDILARLDTYSRE